MFRKKYIYLIAFFCCLSLPLITAQEALLSDTERYYDFLALQGLAARPSLNYRTLSDSDWAIEEGAAHPWQNQNLGTRRHLFGDVSMRIYGPELFNSVNTAAPYGQNDGALWQGRGYNGSLTGGVRFEGYGVELTFKPQLAFSQNAAFDYIEPRHSGDTAYADKGAVYGYYGLGGIDAPQRFGDDPFFTWDWGDSEVRYSWKTLTVGFGTQAIWLGPAQINPIIHSNNAASYPKLDIGLRKQRIVLPWLNWYLGDIETRAWWGYLSESDYFDNDADNDHNLITGFSVAYAPPFAKGLTIGLNRIMLSKWDAMNYEAIFTLLWPVMENTAGYDENDQRASIIIDYLLPSVGFNIYLEWGRNDFSGHKDLILRYPFHTQGWTAGARKSFTVKQFAGNIFFEITALESSRDYEFLWPTTFYAHHVITQGHTNKGQWLGAGLGTGGNSQILGFDLYTNKMLISASINRANIDNDYVWFMHMGKPISEKRPDEYKFKAIYSFSVSNTYFITKNLRTIFNFVVSDIQNPAHVSVDNFVESKHLTNFHVELGIKYSF